MRRINILAVAAFTLIGFPIIGAVLLYLFSDFTFIQIFENKVGVALQVITGVLFGSISSFLAIQLIRHPKLESSTKRYTRILESLNLDMTKIILISVAAGVGEEILFRGCLQPMFGLWPVAIIFVALHGYLNPFDWKITVYGLFLILASAGFGYLFKNQGIYAPILAHGVFDFIILFYVKNKMLHPEDEHHEIESHEEVLD